MMLWHYPTIGYHCYLHTMLKIMKVENESRNRNIGFTFLKSLVMVAWSAKAIVTRGPYWTIMEQHCSRPEINPWNMEYKPHQNLYRCDGEDLDLARCLRWFPYDEVLSLQSSDMWLSSVHCKVRINDGRAIERIKCNGVSMTPARNLNGVLFRCCHVNNPRLT